jgi:hypothetical protein
MEKTAARPMLTTLRACARGAVTTHGALAVAQSSSMSGWVRCSTGSGTSSRGNREAHWTCQAGQNLTQAMGRRGGERRGVDAMELNGGGSSRWSAACLDMSRTSSE